MPEPGHVYEGGCRRGRTDCEAVKSIASNDMTSFVCCGEIDAAARGIPQDQWRFCWKSETVDEIGDYDMRDLSHSIAVMGAALAVATEMTS